MRHVKVMTRVQSWTRWVLLGADDSWGATLATGPLGIYALAAFALLMHVLDLATGLRMMQVYGIELEQNPLARFIMTPSGRSAWSSSSSAWSSAAVLLFVRTAQGRPPAPGAQLPAGRRRASACSAGHRTWSAERDCSRTALWPLDRREWRRRRWRCASRSAGATAIRPVSCFTRASMPGWTRSRTCWRAKWASRANR